MKEIKIGWIGLGCRGKSLLEDIVLKQNECVSAVCDVYEDRCREGADAVEKVCGVRPNEYTDYMDVVADKEVNVVIIATSWESHVEIAVAAMNAGKAVAMEVGGAYTLQQCHLLVETYERTRVPFMFLENCCFGRREMMALNMAQKGLFGELVHCEGCYAHDLRDEISFGRENRHYRLRNYLVRNCENYPTHDLGPIAKVLNINNGNRILSLASFSSKSAGLHEYINKNKSDDEFLRNAEFAQGDIITTVIKCAGGETILLKLDTTLPRYYSRGFTVRGTNGMYEEVTDSVFIDTPEDKEHDFDWRKECVGNADKYAEKWEHPIWKKYIDDGVQGSHDGMDWLEFKAFFEALRNDEPMPVDVYDAATWMSVSVLSEMSIAKGGAVMAVPDFTAGKWHTHSGF
jgi:hypothetical protein